MARPIWAHRPIPFITRLSGTSIVGADASRQALVEMAADLSRRMGAGARG
ncbi:MAG: hypothetical protein ACU0A5_00365 [Salipiger marinus]